MNDFKMSDHVILPSELLVTNGAWEHFDVLFVGSDVMSTKVTNMSINSSTYLASKDIFAFLDAIIPHGFIGFLVIATDAS